MKVKQLLVITNLSNYLKRQDTLDLEIKAAQRLSHRFKMKGEKCI